METTNTTSKMFDRSNVQEYPNPKPLTVERVMREIRSETGAVVGHETLFIRNAHLDPAAHTGRN